MTALRRIARRMDGGTRDDVPLEKRRRAPA